MNDYKKRTYTLFAVLVVAVLAILFVPSLVGPKKAAYSDFISALDAGTVSSVTIDGDKLKYKLSGSSDEYVTKYADNIEFVRKLNSSGASVYVKSDSISPNWTTVICVMSGLMMTSIIVFVFTSGQTRTGQSDTSKNGKKRKIVVDKSQDVTFADVGGNAEAKAALKEIIDFLEHPKEYTKMGAKLPKGMLLVGPPGTGKTLMAKAVAGEANVPFIYMAGSDFVEVYVGLGAAKVRRMFEIAEKNAPCIVFIDEIDAVGKKRDSFSGGSGSDEREQTLNQLLSEMDGFNPSKGVVVLAATNRPDILDEAVTRPGRFDRRIIIDKPDFNAREQILEAYIKKITTDGRIDTSQIAYATSGCTGADLANIINEAAIKAVRNNKKAVGNQEIQEAMDEILSGSCNHSVVLTEIEKCIIASHEAAHALACMALDPESIINKISIIPRSSNSLGYTLNYRNDERHVAFKDEMLLQIRILLAGYCGEYVLLDNISSAAEADLREATMLARQMVTVYGMSTEFGPVTLDPICGPVSDSMNFCIDRKVAGIIKHCYTETIQFIQDNEETLQNIATELAQREVLCYSEIREILGDRSIDVPKFDLDNEITTLTSPLPFTVSALATTPTVAEQQTPIAPAKETEKSKTVSEKTVKKRQEEKPAEKPSEMSPRTTAEKPVPQKKNEKKSSPIPSPAEVDEPSVDSVSIEMDIPDEVEMEVPGPDDTSGLFDEPDATGGENDDIMPDAPTAVVKTVPAKKEMSETDAKAKKALENILNISSKNSRERPKRQTKKKAPQPEVEKSKDDDDELTEDDY